MADDLSPLVDGFGQFAKDLSGKGLQEMLDVIGLGAKEDVAQAVRRTPARRGSLADQSMSGWRRGKKGAVGVIQAEYKIEGSAVRVQPRGSSGGPMRVLEDGRKAHAAGSMRQSGTYTSKRTGVSRPKLRKVNRQVHPYPGKNTWSKAIEVVARESPKRAESVLSDVARRAIYF